MTTYNDYYKVDKTLKELREMTDGDLANFIINKSGYSGGSDGEIGSNFETADGYEVECWCPYDYIGQEIDAYKPQDDNFIAWDDRPESFGFVYECWEKEHADTLEEECDIYSAHEFEIDAAAMLRYIKDCDRDFLPEDEDEDEDDNK